MPNLNDNNPVGGRPKVKVAADVRKPVEKNTVGTRVRILSYNVQVGIATQRPHHYLTESWRHLVPHPGRFRNLDNVAHLLHDYDIVGLQEVDAGSLRSNFVNLTEYLAEKANFPFWHHRVNRRLGRFAQHASGLLSRIRPSELTDEKLPGLIPGRGFTMARFGQHHSDDLAVINIHLALGRRTRMIQVAYLAELVNKHKHVVLMGDMNCRPDSAEMRYLFQHTSLREPLDNFHTFPSWQPNQNIDHILVTPGLEVHKAQVLNHSYSDHLPISMELDVPDSVKLLG